MRNMYAAAIARRRKRLLSGGGSTAVSASASTFTSDDYSIADNGTDTATFTITARNSSGVPLSGKSATIARETITISAANSLILVDNDTPANSESINVTVILRDASNRAVPDIAAADIVVSSTGTGNTIGAFSGRTSQAGAISCTFSSTVNEAKTLSFTVFGVSMTDTVGVTVGAGGSLTYLLTSKWSNSTGTGNTAVLDGTNWNYRGGTGGEVISATGLDFPVGVSNCLRVTFEASQGWTFIRRDDLPVIGIGSTRYFRWYERVVFPDGAADDQQHPHQDGFSGGQHNFMMLYFNQTGTYQVQLWGGDNNAYPNKRYIGQTALTKGVTYRFEVAMTRIDTTTYTMGCRVYDEAEALVMDSGDFWREDSGGSVTLENMVALTFYDVNNTDGFNMGSNENPGSGSSDYFSYQSATAIADDQGWLGSYPAAGEP